MNGSVQRVRDIINGRATDRPPLFDLLRNDAVICHFAGLKLAVNADDSMPDSGQRRRTNHDWQQHRTQQRGSPGQFHGHAQRGSW